MSVVGVKLPPPPMQQLRSLQSAALPLLEQGGASGGSVASSPGSEVMRAHSSLEELSSPKRLG